MNLKTISESELRIQIEKLAHEERRIGLEVLHYLREIDARKIFAGWGYSSLFEYCTKELKYSEGGAYRRIAAMRLLKEVPEYERKLEAGAISVATLSQVQSFLVQEKRQLGKTYSLEEKRELLEKIDGKSSQQVERILSPDKSDAQISISAALLTKLEKLKSLSTKTYSDILEDLVDRELKKLEKPLPPVEVESATRFIPAGTRRAVWQRDQGQCTHTDATGKRCTSKQALQFEHVIPFGKGGKTTAENLKLLCPAHNQLAAIQAYGLEKMRKFWGS